MLHGALLGGVVLAVASSLALRGGHVSAARTAHPVSAAVEPALATAPGSASQSRVPTRSASAAIPVTALTPPALAAALTAPASPVKAPMSILPAVAPVAAATAAPTDRLTRAAAVIDPAISVPVSPAGADTSATQSSAADSPATNTATSPPAVYIQHTITAGETLRGIADSYGISVATLEANNEGISDFNVIHAGQSLRVPATDGVLYSVRQGDTVGSISQRFGISSSAILDEAANNLQNADTIHAGQTLLVPVEVKDVVPASRPPAPIARPIVVPPSHPVLSPPSQPPAAASAAHPAAAAAHAVAPAAPKPVATLAPKPAAPPPTAVPVVSGFIWPVRGIITQGFGVPELGYGAPHTGIDIAVPVGTAVAAAGSGTVIFAGGDPCCSFGYYIVISHAGGIETLYGHLSRIGVTVGQAVRQGQIIGNSGDTGYSTGPHVHFQVQIGETPVNPMQYLP